jgi:hypothetical protein
VAAAALAMRASWPRLGGDAAWKRRRLLPTLREDASPLTGLLVAPLHDASVLPPPRRPPLPRRLLVGPRAAVPVVPQRTASYRTAARGRVAQGSQARRCGCGRPTALEGWLRVRRQGPPTRRDGARHQPPLQCSRRRRGHASGSQARVAYPPCDTCRGSQALGGSRGLGGSNERGSMIGTRPMFSLGTATLRVDSGSTTTGSTGGAGGGTSSTTRTRARLTPAPAARGRATSRCAARSNAANKRRAVADAAIRQRVLAQPSPNVIASIPLARPMLPLNHAALASDGNRADDPRRRPLPAH